MTWGNTPQGPLASFLPLGLSISALSLPTQYAYLDESILVKFEEGVPTNENSDETDKNLLTDVPIHINFISFDLS